MLKIYDGDKAYPLIGLTDYYIKHLYGGFDQLCFDISTEHEMYPYLSEEIRVEDEENWYLVKGINERGTVSTISCELDLDDFKNRFYKKFRSETLTVGDTVQKALPDTWRLIDESYINFKRTIEIEGATDLDVLEKCMDTFDCVFSFSAKEKTVTILNPVNFGNLGCYFTDELNLKDISFKGSTSGYITRLYPYGKDGLSIADVNDGKEYVEDYSYTNKIVCGYWKDDRYTVPDNLKADAVEKLKSLAYPSRSYQCNVSDLAKMSEDYKFLDIKMYTKATLIDRKRKNQVEHRIVEYQEYPEVPEKNIVTLSTSAQRIETQMKQIKVDIKNEAETLTEAYQEAVKNATNLITGNSGGYVLLDPAKKPERILIMDNADKAKARNVWQWNKQGFGHSNNGINGPYDTAITMDGQIVAGFILAGTMLADRIKGGTLTLGGINNDSGVLKILDASKSVIGTWDSSGIHISKGQISAKTIKGDVLTLGGDNNENGAMKIIDKKGVEIGRWDNAGINVKNGEISAGTIKGDTLTLGGSNNANGTLKVLAQDGTSIGTWDNTGINVSAGSIAGATIESTDRDGRTGVEIKKGNIIFTCKEHGPHGRIYSGYNPDDSSDASIVLATSVNCNLFQIASEKDSVVAYDANFGHNPNGITARNIFFGGADISGGLNVSGGITCINGQYVQSSVSDTSEFFDTIKRIYISYDTLIVEGTKAIFRVPMNRNKGES